MNINRGKRGFCNQAKYTSQRDLSTENKIGIAILLLGATIYATRQLLGRESIPILTQHIGDFALSPLPSVFVNAINVENIYCLKTATPKLEEIANNLLRKTAVATAVYFTLGETILPQILPGTSDPRDVPAAILGATGVYYAFKRSH